MTALCGDAHHPSYARVVKLQRKDAKFGNDAKSECSLPVNYPQIRFDPGLAGFWRPEALFRVVFQRCLHVVKAEEAIDGGSQALSVAVIAQKCSDEGHEEHGDRLVVAARIMRMRVSLNVG